jgi:DNA polymerase-3 subunit delta
MPEIAHTAMPDLLGEIKGGTVHPVYLLHGDEFLYKEAFKSVLETLLPADHQGLNCDQLDGEKANAYEVVQCLNTFPLIPSTKVVALQGAKVFYSMMAAGEFLRRSKDAYDRQDLDESARYLLHLLGLAGISTADAEGGKWKEALQKELQGSDLDESSWVDEVIDHALKENMAIAVHEDDAEVLNDAILKGYPETNHLILTTDIVDKRRKLYKTIKKEGVVVDCSVPTGDRAADRRKQEAALKHHMKAALGPAQKKVAPGTFEVLYERVGPDLRKFDSEVKKLVTYVGDRKEILPSDVEQVSERTKEDPIYEMTSAIGDRDFKKTLFYLDSLLKNNIHPLQVLTATTNQIRKMLLAKDFVRGKLGGTWRKGLSYGAFQKTILPQLKEHESDLLTGKTHPFAAYMTLKQSDSYAFAELTGALEVLLDADKRLKRSGHDPKIVLERAMLQICGGRTKP